MILTAEKVTEIFMNCLYDNDEDSSNHVKGIGVFVTVGFHPDRLKQAKQDIIKMLDELNEDFRLSVGMGTSFINMAFDKDKKRWTDSVKIAEQLLCLGSAIDKLDFCLPKEYWSIFPGGAPYVVYKDL